MLNLNGRQLLLGGFHDHWSRWDQRNASVLLAALNYYHYDFVTLMCGPETDAMHLTSAPLVTDKIKIYPGREEFFGWGHVVCINPRAPRIEGDDPDYRKTLRRLKETCDLVILAHPSYPGTWEQIFKTGEMDALLDEGVIDGVNLINTNGFEVPEHREMITWFNARAAAGKRTPIVGGWDAHLVLPQTNLPPVLYNRERPPRGHIDTCGANRTILFCEENNLEAIEAAVLAGDTVIEDLQTGELVGPPELVSFLKENGYAAAIAELDATRDGITLECGAPWIAGSTVQFEARGNEEIRVVMPTIRGLRPADQWSSNGIAVAVWPGTPDARDRDYASVVLERDGYERIFAVETRHPVQLEVLPSFYRGMPGVDIVPLAPFDGEVELEIPGVLKWKGTVRGTERIPLLSEVRDTIHPVRWSATDFNGFERQGQSQLTFLAAGRFEGDWDKIPEFAVNEAKFVPAYTYGAERPYPGPEIFAVYYQLAWDDEAFHLRARVQDPIHFQPSQSGHYLYNADCLQLAIDPLLRRNESIGHVYSFNLAQTPSGPMAHRWLTPEQENGSFKAPPADTTLNSDFLQVTPWDGGLIYELRLPWQELAPAQPQVGHRMGIYAIAFNNNGEGLLDTLHWPVPIEGMWQMPRRWGVLTLV